MLCVQFNSLFRFAFLPWQTLKWRFFYLQSQFWAVEWGVGPCRVPTPWSPAIPVRPCSIATPLHVFPSRTCATAFQTVTTGKTKALPSVVSTAEKYRSWDKMVGECLAREGQNYKCAMLRELCQRVNTATSSPADDVHHYVIPQKLLLTNRFYFQQTFGIHALVGKRKCCSLSRSSPAPVADSFHVATMAWKQRVKFTRISRNNTHTALASVSTFYG
jgi:hypothetical protein